MRLKSSTSFFILFSFMFSFNLYCQVEFNDYYRNGKIMVNKVCQDSLLSYCQHFFYYRNGVPREIVYLENSKVVKYHLYRKNASLKAIGSAKEDKQHGELLLFNRKEELIEVHYYSYGKLLRKEKIIDGNRVSDETSR